jgi:Subunit 21 of Mediator complex
MTLEEDTEKSSQGDDPKEEDDDKDRIDPITELQDAIDGLSLAMFEALRGLRDAVAPESGNLGNAGNSTVNESSGEQDFEEFWGKYRSGDEATVALVHKANGGVSPTRREDKVRIHSRLEMEKDAELVTQLANTVLEKSDQINERVASLPGMDRTRTEQMEYMEKLLKLNQEAAEALEEHYAKARERRDQVRLFVKDHTCRALGILEGDMV